MEFFKKIFEKFNSGFFYVIDKDVLKDYLSQELDYAVSNNLEACANLYIYLSGKKHNITIWNYEASKNLEEKNKGVIFYYNDEEYKSLDELYERRIDSLNGFFKVELPDFDSKFLNEYKEAHPELKVEDYK